MAVLNESGVQIQNLGGVISELQSIAKRKFADIVAPDDELDVSSSSVLGRVLGTVAEQQVPNEELLLMLWQSLDPDQAENLFLDKSLGLSGIYRKEASKGFAGLMLHGQIGVTVPEKSMVASRITGDIFETSSDVTFSDVNTNGVVVKFSTITPSSEYSLGYSTSYGANVYPNLITRSVEGDTRETLAKRFMETVNASASQLIAEVNNDDNVVVRFRNRNTIGTFIARSSATLDLVESFMPVSSISVTADASRQLVDTLDIIQTSVVGWLGVTNPFDSIASTPEEDDKQFRIRGRISKSIKSVSNRTGMYSDLYDLNGVIFANIKENIYNNSAGGVSGKGIAVVVLGGDDNEIAEVIERNLPLSCLTSGTITKTITDSAGSQDIRFSRPENVAIKMKLSLLTDNTFPQNGKVLIQEALVKYIDSLDVGESVLWSKLFSAINDIKGQSVNTLQIAKVGGTLANNNVDMLYNQKPVITFEDIEI